ncbi:MAG: DNA translocase FtsK 4TM domain-containing protein [Pseudomonadota bacterium]
MPVQLARGTREAALIALALVAVYLVVALGSYDRNDPGWSFSAPVDQVANGGGVVGAWLADFCLYLFGYLAYLFPLLVGGGAWVLLRDRHRDKEFGWVYVVVRGAGLLMTLVGGCGIATLHFHGQNLPLDGGGILGDLAGNGLAAAFNPLGSTLFLLALFLAGITFLTGLSWLWLMDTTGRVTLLTVRWLRVRLTALREQREATVERKRRETAVKTARKKVERREPPKIEAPKPPAPISERVQREKQQPLFQPTPLERNNALPALSLLDEPPQQTARISEQALQAVSRQVEMKLNDFGIDAEVVAVHPGPVITRFELQLAPGVKVSRVTNLAKDLARSLSTVSVRVVEVIPGKTVIGLELPNEQRDLVTFGEIVKSAAFDKSASNLTLALGKDIAGNAMVVDLQKMPHLLVAGTTGSGKSVAVNAMILSLLYKATAEDVRLIMIDPKMLELSVYDGIPHLLAPVVTDMADASNALRWSVAEMERRYRLMSKLGVRNIAGYNRKVKDAAARGEPIKDPFFVAPADAEGPTEAADLETLPFIVIIVDELADLMMVAGKKLEELIARLAQKARASGMHLILATQRPSVDVITGLIKANIPSRIGFQVSSKIDSRTILDQMGAEQLLGHGDMLYLTPGMPTPTRVHGAFVGDHEVHNVVSALHSQGEPDYIDEVLNGPSDEAIAAANFPALEATGGSEGDALYDQAVRIVTESRRASISGVQRRLKIGYNRAARMIEQMEEAGIVSAVQSNGNREVLAAAPPQV